MVELPRHGCTVDGEGKIVWGWSHNDPGSTFTSFPPYISDHKGNVIRILFHPDHEILDLEKDLSASQMKEVLDKQEHIRWRKQPDGSRRLRIIQRTAEGAEVETDHHIQTLWDRTIRKQEPDV